MEKMIFCEKLIISFDQLDRLFGSAMILSDIKVEYKGNQEFWLFIPQDIRSSLITISELKTAIAFDGPNPIKVRFELESEISECMFSLIETSFSPDFTNVVILKLHQLIDLPLEVFSDGEES